jgi:hypothetical protein
VEEADPVAGLHPGVVFRVAPSPVGVAHLVVGHGRRGEERHEAVLPKTEREVQVLGSHGVERLVEAAELPEEVGPDHHGAAAGNAGTFHVVLPPIHLEHTDGTRDPAPEADLAPAPVVHEFGSSRSRSLAWVWPIRSSPGAWGRGAPRGSRGSRRGHCRRRPGSRGSNSSCASARRHSGPQPHPGSPAASACALRGSGHGWPRRCRRSSRCPRPGTGLLSDPPPRSSPGHGGWCPADSGSAGARRPGDGEEEPVSSDAPPGRGLWFLPIRPNRSRPERGLADRLPERAARIPEPRGCLLGGSGSGRRGSPHSADSCQKGGPRAVGPGERDPFIARSVPVVAHGLVLAPSRPHRRGQQPELESRERSGASPGIGEGSGIPIGIMLRALHGPGGGGRIPGTFPIHLPRCFGMTWSGSRGSSGIPRKA